MLYSNAQNTPRKWALLSPLGVHLKDFRDKDTKSFAQDEVAGVGARVHSRQLPPKSMFLTAILLLQSFVISMCIWKEGRNNELIHFTHLEKH